ncbi:MAG: helix-turn-helix domain-containing protein [Sphaerochaeta sp.]
MPRQKQYQAEIHDRWAWSLAIKGATVEEIANAFGVTKRTINRWVKDSKTFNEALKTGREVANAQVEKSLFERAVGYDKETSEKLLELDKNGNTKPLKVKTVTTHIPPDVGAIAIWLKNRDPENWKDKVTVYQNKNGVLDDLDKAMRNFFVAPQKYEVEEEKERK